MTNNNKKKKNTKPSKKHRAKRRRIRRIRRRRGRKQIRGIIITRWITKKEFKIGIVQNKELQVIVHLNQKDMPELKWE